MKIAISKTHREKIQTFRDELSATLEGLLGSNRELGRLTKRQESLQSEIAALEKSANFEDKKAVQTLGEQRIELELVNSKLSQIPGLGQEQLDSIMNLLRQTGYAITAALTPTMEDYAAEIAKLIRPFCPDEAYAKGLAYQTPAAKSLCAVCSRPYGGFAFSPRTAQDAISRCDEILAGELVWEFDNKLGK